MAKKTECRSGYIDGGNRKPRVGGHAEGKALSRSVIAVGILRSTGRWFVVPKR